MPSSIDCGFPMRVLERAYMPPLLPGGGDTLAASPQGTPSSPEASRGNSPSDEFRQPQVGEHEVELRDIGDVEAVVGGEPAAQLEPPLGRALHRLAALV